MSNLEISISKQRRKQQRKLNQIQQHSKKQEKQINHNNPSKIPVRQQKKVKKSDNLSQIQTQKNIKEVVQIQLFVDPANIELTRKKQRLCEDQIKKQIEIKKQQIHENSYNNKLIKTEFQQTKENYTESQIRDNRYNSFNSNIIKVHPFSEEPFIVDLNSESLFDKSSVKTPPPGFSIRKKFNLSKAIPTFPDQNTYFSSNRINSSSEIISPDESKVLYFHNKINK